MPKTTKRIETKRAARIARAHATELPKLPEKKAPSRRSPGYHPPRRGFVRRFPLLSIILGVMVVGGSIYFLSANHIWPFTLHVQPKAKPTPTPVYATVPPAAQSPCLNSDILKSITDTSPAPDQTTITRKYDNAPAMSINQTKLYCAGINTNRGLIVVELDPGLAPNTVNNFVFLAQNHFYDGLKFHRVLPYDSTNPPNTLQIIQGGDPQGNGSGGPSYQFNDEPVKGDYTAGTIAMANSGANTNGSQFFIDTNDNTKALQKQYNLFGHVVQGLDIAQKIQGPNPADSATANITPDVMNHVIVVVAP